MIVCEGRETEPNYFDGLKRLDVVGARFGIRVVKGRGGARLQIVKLAIDRAEAGTFDECWCVLDTERLDNPDARTDYEDAMKLADQNNIKIAASNPSFEVWLNAHFERTCRSFKDGNAACQSVEKHFLKDLGLAYRKNDRDIFRRLRDRLEMAQENARNVRDYDHHGFREVSECNSCTTVDLLVTYLLTGIPPGSD